LPGVAIHLDHHINSLATIDDIDDFTINGVVLKVRPFIVKELDLTTCFNAMGFSLFEWFGKPIISTF